MNLGSMNIGRSFWRAWILANGLGLGAGMALFAVIGEGFKQGGILGTPKANVIVGHLIGLLLAGALFGIAQWLVLRRFVPRTGWAVLAASAGLWLGYVVGYMMKDMLDKAGSTDTDKLLAALDDLKSDTIAGPVVMRALDHQSTLGAWVGLTTRQGKMGTMKNWTYEDGAKYLFPEAEVKAARKQ